MTRTTTRLFISYSRKDGEAFARDLRTRLAPIFGADAIWRDRDAMEGGKNWWQQITEALDNVAFMVLVATPEAMASTNVEDEWRYARQQGVCIYPVQVPGLDIDFSVLPRWMRDSHFYNLDKEWETFVNYLKSPCTAVKVPFMADRLPEHFVERAAPLAELKTRLLDADRKNPVAITTAFQGAGGFGKTTLALALCHDADIQTSFDDGILWVTLGENATDAAIVEALRILYRAVAKDEPSFTTADEGKIKLAEKLADKDCLIVIDDVWNAADLRPFLHGGDRCARLITTRDVAITVGARAQTITVDIMTEREAVRLLASGIDGLADADLRKLVVRLGEWALMLEIANAMMRERMAVTSCTPVEALTWLTTVLDKRGVLGIRRDDKDGRKTGAEGVLAASMELLTLDARARLAKLAVFRDDADVPLSSVMALWGMDEFDADDLIVRFARLALLRYNISTGTIRLHDVIRETLGTHIADMPALNAQLIDAWCSPYILPDAYAWHYYVYHLIAAGRADRLRALLLDPAFLHAKLNATDANALIADCDALAKQPPRPDEADDTEAVRLLRSALGMSAHALNVDKAQLSSQLFGRLMTWRADKPAVRAFTDALMAQVVGVYPAFPDGDYRVLNPAGGALLRTLTGHTKTVNHVAITLDGMTAVSTSLDVDGTLIVWDVATGSARHTLTGHTKMVNHAALTSNGATAVSASEEGTLIVWDVATGTARHRLTGHMREVNHVALTPDGATAVSASGDETLIVWDVATGTARHRLTGHTDTVYHVALTPDGATAVSASRDKTLIVWDVATGTARHTMTGHTETDAA